MENELVPIINDDPTQNHEAFEEDVEMLSFDEKYTKTFDEMLTGEIENFPLGMNKFESSANVTEEINVDEMKESEQIEDKVSGEKVEKAQKEEIYEEKTKVQNEVKIDIYENDKKDNKFVEETLENTEDSDYEEIDLEEFGKIVLQDILAEYGDTETSRKDATKVAKELITTIEDIFERELFDGAIEVEILKKTKKENLEGVKDEAKKLVEVILSPEIKENVKVQVEEIFEHEYENIKTQTDDLGKFEEKLPN